MLFLTSVTVSPDARHLLCVSAPTCSCCILSAGWSTYVRDPGDSFSAPCSMKRVSCLSGHIMSRMAGARCIFSTTAARTAGLRTSAYESLETLAVDSPSTGVARVTLNRPKKSNAMNRLFWKELPQCMDALAEDPGCRAILLVGAGRNFTSGLDIQDHMELLAPPESSDPARRAFELRKLILAYQRTFTSMETVGVQ